MSKLFRLNRKLEKKYSLRTFFSFITLLVLLFYYPFSSTVLTENIRALHFGNFGYQMNQVYAILHGRPTETCKSFNDLHRETFEKMESSVKEYSSRNSEVSNVFYFIGTYDKGLKDLFLGSSDQNCWKDWDYWGYFQSHYGRDVPFVMLFEDFGLSTVHYILFNHIMVWIGFFSVYLIALHFSRSAFLGFLLFLLNLAVFSIFSYGAGLSASIAAVYLSIYVLLHFSRKNLYRKGRHFQGAVQSGILILLFIVQLYHNNTIYPFVHKVNASFVLIGLLAVSILTLDKRVFLRFILLCTVFYSFNFFYNRKAEKNFAQITFYNQAASEGFSVMSPLIGLFERPNPAGFPPSDLIFPRIMNYDYYLSLHATFLITNQSSAYIGREYLKQVLKESPLSYPEAALARFLIQTFFPAKIYSEFRIETFSVYSEIVLLLTGTGVFFLSLVMMLLNLRSVRKVFPILLFTVWHYYGISVILYYLHNHNLYHISGKIMIFTFSPLLLFQLLQFRKKTFVKIRNIYSLIRSQKRLKYSAVCLLLAFLFLIPGLNWLLKKEFLSLRLWSNVHIFNYNESLMKNLETPDELYSYLDKFKEQGVYEKGTTEMYLAWILHTFCHHSKVYRIFPARPGETNLEETRELYRKRSEELYLQLYSDALKNAPNNHHFPSYALMFGHPDWKEIFRKAISKWPDDPYVPYMAQNLYLSSDTELEKRISAAVYEESMKKFLKKSAKERKGYSALPELRKEGVLIQSVLMDGISAGSGRSEEYKSGEIRNFNSPRFKIGFYLNVTKGILKYSVKDRYGNTVKNCSQDTADPSNIYHYRIIDCKDMENTDSVYLSLHTGDAETAFLFRDFYPMFTILRFRERMR